MANKTCQGKDDQHVAASDNINLPSSLQVEQSNV